MKARPFLVYTALRLLFFAVPLGLLMILLPPHQWWIGALFAALIGLALSVIFLRRPRTDVSAELVERRRRHDERESTDEDVETFED